MSLLSECKVTNTQLIHEVGQIRNTVGRSWEGRRAIFRGSEVVPRFIHLLLVCSASKHFPGGCYFRIEARGWRI
jgi:hypothetical protein